MAFADLVSSNQARYTNFKVYGYDYEGTLYATLNLQIPYYITVGTEYGGKNSPSEIHAKIYDKYWNKAGNYFTATQTQIQNYMNTAPNSEKKYIGVDCSGLVFWVLNESSKPNTSDTMDKGLVAKQFKQTGYANGVSASNLTSTSNGTQKTKAQDIVVGCTMRMDSGGHVLVVYKVDKNTSGTVTKIYYAHSSGSVGPHTGYVTIGDSQKDLKDSKQTWSDSAYTDATAKSLYNHTILLSSLTSLV